MFRELEMRLRLPIRDLIFELLMTFSDSRLLYGRFSCVHIFPLQTPTIWPVGSRSAQRPKGVGHFHAPLTSTPLLFRMNISLSRYVDLIRTWHEFWLRKLFVLCKREGIFLGQVHVITNHKKQGVSVYLPAVDWLCSLKQNNWCLCYSFVSYWIWYILKVHSSIIMRVHVCHRNSNLLLLCLLEKCK